MRKTNDKTKKAPIVVDMVVDESSAAYCDPETGVCAVPSPGGPSAPPDEETTVEKTKPASGEDPSAGQRG